MTYPIGSLVGYIDIQGAAAADASVRGVQRSLDLTGESAARAGVQFDRTGRALLGSSDAAAKATSSASRFRAAQLSQIAAQERYNALLELGTASTRQLAAAEASLVRANERVRASMPTAASGGAWWVQAAKGAEGAAASTSRFAGSMAGALKTAGQLGLMFGAFEVARKAIDIGKEANAFERDLVMIRTNVGGSVDSLKSMHDAILALAPDVATGPDELATSLYHIESVGLRGAQAFNVLRIAAEGAKVGQADLEDTTNALTSTVASGIPGVTNMAKAMGQLVAIVGTGDMKFTDLNDALATGGLSILKGYGLSLTDVGAALATFGDNNIRGRDAMTKLIQAVQSMAVVAPKGQAQLEALGLTTDQLAKDLQSGGLPKAVDDLKAHLDAAGIKGDKLGATLTSIFTKRAGTGLAIMLGQFDRLHTKLDILGQAGDTFASKWEQTKATASFAMHQLGTEAETAGIRIAENVTPAVAELAHLISAGLPQALDVGKAAVGPFVAAWHEVDGVVTPVAHALTGAGDALKPVAPLLKGTAAAAVSMWLAFKGYQIATLAVDSVRFAAANLAANARNSFTSIQAGLAGNGTAWQQAAIEADLAAKQMQADFDVVGLAALQSAADQDRAAAMVAVARADEVAASSAATDKQVADADARATAALAAARTSQIAATEAAVAAEGSAAAINVAGRTARIGWASLAGPLGLAALGVFTLVTMFHRSSAASREAADAAKAYTDALHDDGGRATVIDAITKQLIDNDVPETIKKLNDAYEQAGKTAVVSGNQFVNAIEAGGKPLDTLRAKLQKLIDTGTFKQTQGYQTTPAADAATKLLNDLNAQYSGLSAAASKELLDAKTFGLAASSVDQVSKATRVASDTAAQYARMLGIQVDKNGVAAVSAKALTAAVSTVRDAYANATTTGSAFLASLNTFSTSAATAADRAAIIGSTLKAANGDALAFAGSMAGTTTAVDSLVDAFKSERDQLAQQSQDQSSAAERVAVAQKRLNEVRSKGKSTAAELASAEKSLHDAQNAANQQGSLTYADTMRAALRFRETQDGLKASIDSTAHGAGSLVQQLQGMQDAAVAAASAMFQHEKATKGAGTAADDAYNIYRSKTRGALIEEASQLGLTDRQARALAKTYFGMNGKKVKTLIESEGTDKLTDVLTKIGKLLARITGQPWNVKVKVSTVGSVPSANAAEHHMETAPGPSGVIPQARAGGGPVTAGIPYIVGENRPELFVPNVNGRVLPSVPGGMANGGQQKTVHIEHLTLVQNYPEQDKDTAALPRQLRNAGEQIGSFL